MRVSNSRRISLAVLAIAMMAATGAEAQPLTHRTPNLEGTWVTAPWNLFFAFNHRFRVVGDDAAIGDILDDAVVTNSPTFNLALGLWSPAMVGVRYASKPVVRNPDRGNEWFPYIKVAPFRTSRWSVSTLAGYNSQAESVDGEVSAQTSLGRFELLGAVRGFSDALHSNEAGLALAGGVGVRLTNFLMLAGDVGGFVAGPDTANVAWSAGVHLAIPFTPHTFSLQVSNSGGTTLQEASWGGFGDDLAWGFEFTVPFSGFARWGRIFDQGSASAVGDEPARRVVEVEMRQFRFEADTVRVEVGGTVRWINRDAVAHTSTADDGYWRSPLIGPGETFSTRFERVGAFSYHCLPHPRMRGVVIVEASGGAASDSEVDRRAI